MITHPYTAHCMGACSAKGERGLFSPSLSRPPFNHQPNYTVLPMAMAMRARCKPEMAPIRSRSERELFIDNLLVRIHFIIVMIR